tara:strand:+ start:61 stop:906 length:846 start_codon:yes stop_codon:yes gene_type:complete
MITAVEKEGNTYDKFIKRRCLDRVRSKYHLSLERGKGGLDVESAIRIALSVPDGVYYIIADFIAWFPREGDRCDVLDITPTTIMIERFDGRRYIQGRDKLIWRPARVIKVTKPFTDLQAYHIHYKTWDDRYDEIITGIKLDRIQEAFKKTPNWRPEIKGGDYVEFLVPNNFGERYWRVGIILKNQRGKLDLMIAETLDSKYTKRRIELFRKMHNVSLDEFYSGYSNSHTLIDGHKVFLYKDIDINSEMIALAGTHLRQNIRNADTMINKIARRLGYSILRS